MTDDHFRVARRWAGTPFDLTDQPDPVPLIQRWHQPMTPFLRAIGYGLFALTDADPNQFQEVAAKDLLEVIAVAKHPLGNSATEAFHGQHYRDAFDALERMFSVTVPLKTKRVNKSRSGRRADLPDPRQTWRIA